MSMRSEQILIRKNIDESRRFTVGLAVATNSNKVNKVQTLKPQKKKEKQKKKMHTPCGLRLNNLILGGPP